MSDKIRSNSITYLFRNIKSGYSIHKVFAPILANQPDTNVCEVPHHQADICSIIKNLMYVRKNVTSNDIVHMTGGPHYLLMAVPFRKNLLTVHDLVLLRNSRGIKRFLFRWLWFKIPFMCAKRITCISNTVREELLKEFSISPKKVITVYNPVDPAYKFTPKEFNVSNPRILHIGTAWNKNVVRTIEALNCINCTLVIIGNTTQEIDEAVKKSNINVEQLHDLTDEELLKQYEQADIISFPSVFEGFGMPIVEGQAVGRIVLTSDMDPMKEVAANGACLVNPYDIESIRQGFVKIIKDANYRGELVRRGTVNVQRFKLESIQSQFKKIYKEL